MILKACLCLSVCLSVCQVISFKSFDVRSSYLHIQHISDECRSNLYTKVIRSRSPSHEQKNVRCYSVTPTLQWTHCVIQGWHVNMIVGNSRRHICPVYHMHAFVGGWPVMRRQLVIKMYWFEWKHCRWVRVIKLLQMLMLRWLYSPVATTSKHQQTHTWPFSKHTSWNCTDINTTVAIILQSVCVACVWCMQDVLTTTVIRAVCVVCLSCRIRGLRRTVSSSRKQRSWTLEEQVLANESDRDLVLKAYVAVVVVALVVVCTESWSLCCDNVSLWFPR